MKKHLIFASALLLTTGTTKLDCMETNQLTVEQEQLTTEQKNILQATKKLCTLVGITPKDSLSQDIFLPTLSNFSITTEDKTKLQEGILAMTYLTLKLPKNSQAASIHIAMYNRLTELLENEKQIPTKEAKLAAKKLCRGVIDDISDDEKEEDKNKINLTRINFDKHQVIKGIAEKTLLDQNIFNSNYEALKKTKENNDLYINTLKAQLKKAKEENNNVEKQIIENQTEIEILKTAYDLLNIKKEKQIEKMEEQKKELTDTIDDLNADIKELSENIKNLSNPEFIKEHNTELTQKKMELTKLQNALSYLTKDLAEIKGETGIFSNILWNINLYSYNNVLKKEKETKKN